MEFTIYDDDDVATFLEGLEERPQRRVRIIAFVCRFLQVFEDVCDHDLMVFVERRWPSQQMKRLQLYLMNPWRPNMYFCNSVCNTLS